MLTVELFNVAYLYSIELFRHDCCLHACLYEVCTATCISRDNNESLHTLKKYRRNVYLLNTLVNAHY